MMMHDEGTNLYDLLGIGRRDNWDDILIAAVVVAISIAVAIAFASRKGTKVARLGQNGSVPAAE